MSPDAPYDGTAPQLPPGLCALSPNDPAWIGSLRVVARIGTGSDPPVYAALTKTGRCLAVETHLPQPEETDQENQIGVGGGNPWFATVVEQRRAVQATCLTEVVEADPGADMPWLACDFVAGRSLAEHVRQFGALPEQHLLCLAAGLGEALAAVHAAGFTHGNLSAERVVLSPHGPVVLAPDFAAFGSTGTAENNRPGDIQAWAQLVAYAAGAVPGTDESSGSDLASLPDSLHTVVTESRAVTPELRPSAAWATDTVLAASGFTSNEREQQSFAWMVRDLLDLAWTDIDAAGHDPLQWRALAANPPRHAAPVSLAPCDESDERDTTTAECSGPIRSRRTGLVVALGLGAVGALTGLSVGGCLAAQALSDTNTTTDTVADSTEANPETESETEDPDEENPEPSPTGQAVQFGNLTFHVPEEWEVDVDTAGVAIPSTLEIDTNNPACAEADAEADAEQLYLAGLSECGVLVFYGPERISGLQEFAEDPALASLAEPLSEHHPAHSLTGEAPPCHTAMEFAHHDVPAGEHVAVQQEDVAAIGEYEAHYREWVRPCVGAEGVQETPHSEQTYIQRDWFLPDEQIYVVDEWNTEGLSDILAEAEQRD